MIIKNKNNNIIKNMLVLLSRAVNVQVFHLKLKNLPSVDI